MVAVVNDSFMETRVGFQPTLDEKLGPENRIDESVFTDIDQVITAFDSLRSIPGDVAIVALRGLARPWYLTHSFTRSGREVRSTLIDITPHEESRMETKREQGKRTLFKVISLIGKPEELDGEWHIYEVDSKERVNRESHEARPLGLKEFDAVRKLKVATGITAIGMGRRFLISGQSVTEA